MRHFLLLFVLFSLQWGFSQTKKILLFVSHEDTYYSEFIVAKEALESRGYQVDVRSASTMTATTYMVPANTTIDETANSLPGSSHQEFRNQFLANFGTNWNENLNAIPLEIQTGGSIMDVSSMQDYEAFVIAGGTGVLAYRVDGTYATQGTGLRELSTVQVENVALKISQLAKEGLLNGKPVLAQCHGASLPVFWRIDGTSGPGAENIGISLIKSTEAAGFPDSQTALDYADLGVTLNSSKAVSIVSPNSQFLNDGHPNERIIMSRDWYPQTIAHAVKTLLNVIETYPSLTAMKNPKSVLILHGGAIDENNCSASNRENDIPCNYGIGPNLPADYTDILNLLEQPITPVDYNFTVSNLNITALPLPFDNTNEAEMLSYFKQYDAIVFFKHWSTGITDALQNALVNYVDDGGGILNLHHGLYNDIDGPRSKNILIDELFGVSSEMSTWSANLTNYNLVSTNYGHFVSNYFVNFQQNQPAPASWISQTPLVGSNLSYSNLPVMPIFDELYNNMLFVNGAVFGNGVNEITPLLSNDQSPGTQMHTSGFVKTINKNNDDLIGRVAYFEVGERKENFNSSATFSRIIQNALLWCTYDPSEETAANGITELSKEVAIYPNPFLHELTISNKKGLQLTKVDLFSLPGELMMSVPVHEQQNEIVLKQMNLKPGLYLIRIHSKEGLIQKKVLCK